MVNWLNLSQASGSGYTIISVTAPHNTGYTRTTNLTVSDGTSSIVIPVAQYGPLDPASSGYTSEYLTFEILTGGTLYFGKTVRVTSSPLLKTIQYSLNGGAWTDWTSYYVYDDVVRDYVPSSAATLNVSAGDIIRVKGNNSAYAIVEWTPPSVPDWYGNAWSISVRNTGFAGTAYFNVFGNALSLIYGDDFLAYNEITQPSCLAFLFCRSNVVDASNLILLPDVLTDDCYNGMFFSCKELVSAPELPATQLAGPIDSPPQHTRGGSCYGDMFRYCSSLVNPPSVLPATTVPYWSYDGMFMGCTSLVTPPVISATTVGVNSMAHMFDGCTSLTTAPDLLAPSAKTGCYYWMFYGCTNLSSIKCMLTSVRYAVSPIGDWVNGVAASGTFTKDSNATFWETGNSGIPNNWTIVNE